MKIRRILSRIVVGFLVTLSQVVAGFFFGKANSVAWAGSNIVPVQLLAINDFHGNLLPPNGSTGIINWRNGDGSVAAIPSGGAAQLGYVLNSLRANHPYSITASGGDNIGASPLISAYYHDEPTIDVFNMMHIDVSVAGNHEFDEGAQELLRIQHGGCHPVDGCYGKQFPGANFPILAANVVKTSDHKLLLPPYFVWRKNNISIGFIGTPLQNVPEVSTPKGVAGLQFNPEPPAINALIPVLKKQGVNAIVLLIHQGNSPTMKAANDPCTNSDTQTSGALKNLSSQISPDVDLIISAHTHRSYICTFPDPRGQPRIISQAASFGRLLTEFSLPYDTSTGKLIRTGITAQQISIPASGAHDPQIDQEVSFWQNKIHDIAERVEGYISQTVGYTHPGPESPIGDLVTDAQNESMQQYGSDFAITNSGGIRSELVATGVDSSGHKAVSYQDIYTVQPFRNNVDTIDLTGKQIVTVLNQQFSNNPSSPKYLQVSAGLHYTIVPDAQQGHRVDASSITVNNKPLDLNRSYHVTVNDFLANGGDGFTVFRQGTNLHSGPVDTDALSQYLNRHSSVNKPYVPSSGGRYTFSS